MTRRSPPAHVRNREELLNELVEQLTALDRLSGLFKNDEPWPAKLIATIIYVICHDGIGKTRSLITQLDMRDQLMCLSTANRLELGSQSPMPLLLGFVLEGAASRQTPRFLLRDPDDFEWMTFKDWWNQPVFSPELDGALTRCDLVSKVRSKDGGSHFDAELDCAKYVNLRAGTDWRFSVDGQELRPDPSHLLSILAIGWELLMTFEKRGQYLRWRAKRA